MATLDAAKDTAPRDVGDKPRSRRGFAGMDPVKVRRLASKGGKAAHEKGTAHRFTSEEARAAGRKGGMTPHRARRTTDAHKRSDER
jgi:general stress protein YciG